MLTLHANDLFVTSLWRHFPTLSLMNIYCMPIQYSISTHILTINVNLVDATNTNMYISWTGFIIYTLQYILGS